jgi:hypothetical protein
MKPLLPLASSNITIPCRKCVECASWPDSVVDGHIVTSIGALSSTVSSHLGWEDNRLTDDHVVSLNRRPRLTPPVLVLISHRG